MGRKSLQPFIYGGLASVTAECGTFPIDTTKTRLQIQGQVIDASLTQLKYRGMFHALLRIFREEGVPALYSGIAPAVLRQATYGTIKIGVYHYMKRLFVHNERDESLPVNILCGVVAGIVSSSVANPTDVLKVRMQARSNVETSESMSQAFCKIYRQEGLPGLWRGVIPTAQRAAVIVGVELPAYDFIKKTILKHEILGDTKTNHFISSFLAGLAGAIASTPIDVVKMVCMMLAHFIFPRGKRTFDKLGSNSTQVLSRLDKTRLMNQRKLKACVLVNGTAMPAIYSSATDCLVQTVRTEGVTALYKGFIPNWVRLGPWNIIFFMTYEQLKKLG